MLRLAVLAAAASVPLPRSTRRQRRSADDYHRGLDCGLRELVYNRSHELLRGDAGKLLSVSEALQLQNCSGPVLEPAAPTRAAAGSDPCPLPDAAATRLYVSQFGSDTTGDGTLARPYATLTKARDSLRAARRGGEPADVVIRSGVYAMAAPLQLTAEDSRTRYAACPGERAVISGARRFTVTLRRSHGDVFQAQVPSGLVGADQLFDISSDAVGTRLVWSREPNGNAETDLQPIGYALAKGNPLGNAPPPTGAPPYVAEWAPVPTRNNSWFPVYGRANDPRGGGNVVWLHHGDEATVYADGRDFWNQTLPAGLAWDPSPGTSHGFAVPAFNATGWPVQQTHPRPLLHCMHHSEWGNHIWEVASVDVARRTFRFGKGGWQEGRYATIGQNPFYVEGAKAALDAGGEWWLDEAADTLWLIPNRTVAGDSVQMELAVPVTPVLFNVSGSPDSPVADVTVQGVTLTHTRRTLMDQYEVPSPGDWSVHAGGVVTVSWAQRVAVSGCSFNRTGGNSVAFLNGVDGGSVVGCDMQLIGDSGVVLIGRLPGIGNNGSAAASPHLTYPRGTTIASNHIHNIGLWGKQTSALFQAVSCNTTFSGNVVYNGPRAGLNINDGFCGGHRIEGNVMFNWVRETQDHGPINTWDRATYVQPDGGIYPSWNRIVGNLIMNGPSGNRDLGNLFPAVDNDDGSAYYWIAENVVAYGGFKNFLGNDKVWRDNLVLYPGGRLADTGNGPCVMAWGGANEHYVNNTCLTRGSGPGVSPYPDKTCSYTNSTARQVLLGLAQNTYYTPDGTYSLNCGGSMDLKQAQAIGVEVGSRVSKAPSDEVLIAFAQRLLRQHM
eukprot:TRINITY_DN32644_c0_g1_i1.p1 TRINITY_DN32644_c0_g1~~TRINITY_DN32644_c0_g1_i1.p1  ORF type:complete len:835 (+),score=217.56 TRINITY_DN32644_c0_g1_i1:48-2552(+)